MASPVVNVQIQKLSGAHVCNFEMDGSCTILFVKERLLEDTQIPVVLQTMVHEHKPLNDADLLHDVCRPGDDDDTLLARLTLVVNFTNAFENPDEATRLLAIRYIPMAVKRGLMCSLDLLEAPLKDVSWNVRSATVEVLVEISEKDDPTAAIDLLASLLADADGNVRSLAALALAQIAKKSGPEFVRPWLLPYFEPLLRDDLASVRSIAVNIIGQVAAKGDEHVLGILSALLEDKSFPVRCAAVSAISQLSWPGDEYTIGLLTRTLHDPDYPVRCATAKALAQVAPKQHHDHALLERMIRLVSTLCDDDHPSVKSAAVKSLALVAG